MPHFHFLLAGSCVKEDVRLLEVEMVLDCLLS